MVCSNIDFRQRKISKGVLIVGLSMISHGLRVFELEHVNILWVCDCGVCLVFLWVCSNCVFGLVWFCCAETVCLIFELFMWVCRLMETTATFSFGTCVSDENAPLWRYVTKMLKIIKAMET